MNARWISMLLQVAWLMVPLALLVAMAAIATGARYIPNNRVGVLEKLWSGRGSVTSGRIIALGGEAGIQADVLRGGLHFGYWFFQYRVHPVPLVTIPQGRIGYMYARDGRSLGPSQALGRVVPASNDFQDARAFLAGEGGDEAEPAVGQRGRQRQVMREGVYAVNLGLFVVITEDLVYRLDAQTRAELQAIVGWQRELADIDGFSPVVVGGQVAYRDPLDPGKESTVDGIGIVTVQDGPTLGPGEIIAPAAGVERADKDFHNNYQDPEAFLRAGGFRGRQYVPLTDGTYFINRWFATVEMVPKTVVPIGFVGVIVSYYGQAGQDVSGANFRHGERVAESQRRVLAGRGEGSRLLQVGLSEAAVLLRKIQSYSDPRLFALAMAAERLAESRQPLVPERVFLAGGTGGAVGDGSASAAAGQGILGLLLNLMVAEKSGFAMAETGSSDALQEFADRMTREAMASMPQAGEIESIQSAAAAAPSTPPAGEVPAGLAPAATGGGGHGAPARP